jgi:hypothetical protein
MSGGFFKVSLLGFRVTRVSACSKTKAPSPPASPPPKPRRICGTGGRVLRAGTPAESCCWRCSSWLCGNSWSVEESHPGRLFAVPVPGLGKAHHLSRGRLCEQMVVVAKATLPVARSVFAVAPFLLLLVVSAWGTSQRPCAPCIYRVPLPPSPPLFLPVEGLAPSISLDHSKAVRVSGGIKRRSQRRARLKIYVGREQSPQFRLHPLGLDQEAILLRTSGGQPQLKFSPFAPLLLSFEQPAALLNFVLQRSNTSLQRG